nr:hypothetical protein [Staphylococcus sp. EG-SA-23]
MPISKNNLFEYEGRIFSIEGDSVDQGGQHEILVVQM